MNTVSTRSLSLRDGTTALLRTPAESDAERLLAYLDRVRRETAFIMFGPEDELPGVDAERRWINGSVKNPLSLKLAAEVEGEIVGLCDVTAGVGLRRARHRGEIGISLLAQWCDRGLGTLMMNELVEWSRRQPEITVLRLGVFSHNHRAIAVYRKCGFVEEGVRRRAVRYEDGRYADEMMMSLWVGEEARDV